MKPNGIITLTTDFGFELGYVGQMKGEMLAINPKASLVDITHAVPPWDIPHASYIVERACPRFPEGSIHLVVVDPGVGTFRAELLVQTSYGWYIAPDNGVLAFLKENEIDGIWRLENPSLAASRVSRTFHGRDIFGPAAAHLSRGVHPSEFGGEHSKLVRLHGYEPNELDDELAGKIIAIDRFGNLITTLSAEDVHQFVMDEPHRKVRVKVGLRTLNFAGTFGDVPMGEALAYIGSGDRLEVAVNGGIAARTFSVKVGDAVSLIRLPLPDEDE